MTYSCKKFISVAILATILPTLSMANDKVIVDVDLSKVIGSQNPLYYGGNNIYPKGGQGLLTAQGEYDPIEMEAIEKLGIQSYRFPGGSEANLYKWKRAIGPLKDRIDNVSGNNRGSRTNEFGSDEFGRMLEKTPFKHGVIMVAWGYETPQDAADWVEYMNAEVGANPNGGKDWAAERAKNGHPKPYGIKYWEIGNEVYGNWELNWGSYPYELDAKRGAANVQKDTASGTNGMLPFGDAKRYIYGGTKYFKQQRAAAQSTWKGPKIKTNGKPNQNLFVKFAPVSLSNPDQPFVLTINGYKWQRVDNFTQSTASDKHFVLEPRSGKITFGNGQQGRIPDADQYVVLDYLSGRQPGFIDYYQKMKDVDPTIQILSCFEKESFVAQMAKANLPFDGLTKHYYPNMLKRGGHQKFMPSLLSGIDISHKIDEMMSWYKKYPNPALSIEDQKIWLTEYDTKNHINQIAIMHTVINNHSNDVAAMLGHSLFLNNDTPMVTDDGIIRPHALPIEVFSKHMFDNFVEVSVTGKPNHYEQRSFPAILASASFDKDKNNFAVVLTNTSETKTTTAQINIKDVDIAPGTKAEVWALQSNTGKIIDDNTKASPNAVSLSHIRDMPNIGTSLSVPVAPGATIIVKWLNKKSH
ncbi:MULTISPECIES: hypothetical protein [unclassified Psychrosphaera]|uniref:hypothetical protein n=1 Tax=unclassified Psychrosphaera TaxID=2641570 RepID=UPI002091414A|nr:MULTISPECIES: hypothetical protein [unclassified Psychrosphaera]